MIRSLTLLETLVSIALSSVVITYASLLLVNVYKNQKQHINHTHQQLDIQSTYLFLFNTLSNSKQITIKNNTLLFHPIDIQSFHQGYYSGFIDLENSSKAYVTTPNSTTTKIKDLYAIAFNHDHIYTLKPKQTEDNKLYFTDPNQSKVISEHYTLIKKESSIFLNHTQLMFNNRLLLDNVTAFTLREEAQHISITLCVKQCYVWGIRK